MTEKPIELTEELIKDLLEEYDPKDIHFLEIKKRVEEYPKLKDKIQEIFRDVFFHEDHIIANCEEEITHYKKASGKLRELLKDENI